MARKIDEIYAGMLVTKATYAELNNINNTSETARYKLWMYIVAVASWTLEKLFDIFIADVLALIKSLVPGTLQWYVRKVKLFQFGQSLVTDQDYYDNTGLDEATIEARKVVKYAAAVEETNGLLIKVAGFTSGDLAPITTPQKAALEAYIARFKYAGVYVSVVNENADSLKLHYRVFYDPLILDANGKRLDGTNDTPVQDAIKNYLINGIEFNGYFINAKCTDEIQNVEGVTIPTLVQAQARYGVLPYGAFADYYQPFAGYLRIINPSDLNLEFIPSPI
jgi:hypothetical protein